MDSTTQPRSGWRAGSGVPCLPARLYFLDWIRIGAFFVLICFHTMQYYGPWDWHVKSPHAGAAIEPVLLLTSPWRMSLLFLISGAASAFLLHKATEARFLRERSARLLVPLVFGMVFIVPPQSFCEVVQKLGYAGGYDAFIQRYLSADPTFCIGADCLRFPAWNHLWFVAYLWVYTLVLACGVALAGRGQFARAGAWLGGVLTGPRAVLWPVFLFAAARILLHARFGDTHALVDDWYNHAVYFPIFVAGALLAPQQRFWRELARLRFVTAVVALGSWGLLVCLHALPGGTETSAEASFATAFVRSTLQWCAIAAVCGFGHARLNVDSAARRYLTQAVFCIYIVHQTILIVIASAIRPLGIAPLTEGIVLVVLTCASSFAMFEAVRRLPLLPAFFGITAPRTAAPEQGSADSLPDGVGPLPERAGTARR